MQKLSNAFCTVEITEDPTYTVDSVDNRPYDRVLNPRGYRRSHFTCTFSIRMDWPDCTRILALIGEGCAVASDCAVLEDDQLLVLQNRDLTRIAVADGQVLSYDRLDRFGVLNAIYPLPDGYLVVGELEVFRMDRSLREKWSYAARGVIVSWEMQEDRILLREEETTYGMNAKINEVELGFDGRVLVDGQPEEPAIPPVEPCRSGEVKKRNLRQRLYQWLRGNRC